MGQDERRQGSTFELLTVRWFFLKCRTMLKKHGINGNMVLIDNWCLHGKGEAKVMVVVFEFLGVEGYCLFSK